MDTPTRGQWRGYAILSGILLLLLLLTLFLPIKVTTPEPADNSELAQAVALYRDEMTEQVDNKEYNYLRHRDSIFLNQHRERNYYSPQTKSSRYNYYDTLVVDINSADTARLQLLRGIGPVYAKRIVKYRSLLGGFVSESQLLEVYGIDTTLFNSIEPHIVISSQPIRKLKINSASLDELRRHPYLDYYQARAILDYRRSVGPLRSSDDLLKVNLLDEKTITKISPYIQYN